MKRGESLLLLGFYVGILVLLVVVPALVPPDPSVASAAALDGYNTKVAHVTVLVWSLMVILSFAIRERRSTDPSGAPAQEPVTGKLDWRELAGVFALFALAYFPLFLARHGPYGEDQYFLTALHRMACGQLPYRDFAFLYGPLMIYPLWGWSQLFGVSMLSYYAFLALLEGVQFALLMGVLQYFVPERRYRYLVFLLLVPFLFDTLMGINWNGMRRLVPALAVVLAAWRPYDRRANICCALVIGVHLAYSHEYALAALFGVWGMYGVMWLRSQERAHSIRAAAVIGAGAALSWLGATLLVLRGSMASYLEHAREVIDMMAAGHAGFRFYWTANSLSLFGLLTLGCAMVGRGLFRRSALQIGDRLLLASLIFALVTLKSGLNRADLWHLDAAFLPLFLAFLLRLPAAAMAVRDAHQKWVFALIAVASLTYLVGIAPNGSLYAVSYLRGFRDTLSGPAPAPAANATRTRSLEFERTQPRVDVVALARYLALPERAQRPVLFYGRAWQMAPVVGVCPGDYKLDDLMYTEFSRPEEAYLREHPDALVVLRREDYERLYGLTHPNAPHSRMPLTPAKQLARWLSTVHYDSSETEARLQDEARDARTGKYIVARYQRSEAFDAFVVLEPKLAQ